MGNFKTFKDTLIGYKRWLEAILLSRAVNPKPPRQLAARNLLLIASTFPPAINGGAYRPAALAKYGPEFGWAITVISDSIAKAPTPAGLHLADTVPKGVRVLRIENNTGIKPSWRWYSHIDGGFLNALSMFRLARRELAENPPSAVMASGPRFHSFVAAYYIARYYKAKLILDYRDEWTECPFDFVVKGNADRWWEKRCLRKADKVIFTTNAQLEHQVKVFRELDRSKCCVIPNGWEPSDFVGDKNQFNGAAEAVSKLSISFVGALGTTGNSPGNLLTTIEKVFDRRKDLLQRFKIYFVGDKSEEDLPALNDFRYPESIGLVENLPRGDAYRLMRESAALLLIYGKSAARYMPGRVFPYIAAGTPLIVYGAEGEAADLVKDFGAGYIVAESDDGALERALDDIAEGRHPQRSDKVKPWLDGHTYEKMAQRIIALAEGLAGQC